MPIYAELSANWLLAWPLAVEALVEKPLRLGRACDARCRADGSLGRSVGPIRHGATWRNCRATFARQLFHKSLGVATSDPFSR